ncbi:alpha-ketoglutarate dehydrogenase [Falsigemmobacter intermedius]|uniref:Pyruvate dehydrogenase E1 component n=1 Tax=Falsigemmobacter intermedius TaxID=1553448 RepID=A0A444MB84_9RHOB|nr:alpha-ketoglutarate dehydrogenase [Falsigemmobacter intermedius]RWY40993.1 alpha-ketoglutarate dehydrogenase [Falsigemmobacter intermedius]
MTHVDPLQTHDPDPQETQEWLDALRATEVHSGSARAHYLLRRLEEAARGSGLFTSGQPFSAYRNTIPLSAQGPYPGDLAMEERLTAIMRWNALVMVLRGNKAYGSLGGHIASYASAAEIFETGFNHFFEAPREGHGGDLVYFQPHSAPGVYARAWLEGRLSEEQLSNYRQETDGTGLSSYPHPWLMPDFWQFPTGSMGLGPLSAVYQARFMRYLEGRGMAETAGRHVWGVFGDGEMDEPESIAGLTLAAREGLDNLTFIINCNLQRLDGPVRGNGQIIQELESLFIGAGWNVIKVLWGSDWDGLFARDSGNALLKRFAETVDGAYQDLGSKDGDYNRQKFFEANPETAALVAHMTDAEINALRRGGHDLRKLYAAFAAAKAHKGRPTVILAKTKKGYGMGAAGESRMVAHQAKKLDTDALRAFRDRFGLPISDSDIEELNFYKPADDSPEMTYLRQRRTALGGALPQRSAGRAGAVQVPPREAWAGFALQGDGREGSTTMAVVRMLGNLLKDKEFGPRIVPIVADEARTFGMDNLFRQIGIYAPQGQLYQPEDAGSMMFYKEATNGQLLEEGITEAGAISSWTAAATSYSVHDLPLLPVYIYYSMFGFQRIGDLIWAAADQRARGILLGATAGRTTLSGEGLQHQDGSSLVVAHSVPNCRSWDPAFSAELAVIMDHATRAIMQEQRDEFHYITVMNENYPQGALPEGAEEDLIRGMYRYARYGDGEPQIRLLGSGTILLQVIAAAEALAARGIACAVYSVTSWSELARDGAATERQNRLAGLSAADQSHIERLLPGNAPVVAATDYIRALPQLIAPWIRGRYVTLGTDGFGRSGTREQLRAFFEVDSRSILLAALEALARDGAIDAGIYEAERAGALQQAPSWTR